MGIVLAASGVGVERKEEKVSLDVYLTDANGDEVYSANITHNLTEMADAAGIYKCLWRPEEIGITKANQLIGPLREGLQMMVSDPAKFRAYDSPNGWGKYDHFLMFVVEYLEACIANPDADVSVSR